MTLPATFTLNNGMTSPAVGVGTFQGESGNSKVKDAVKLALKLGYKHLDGACAYGNERGIGEAIKESGIPREELFVTSKLAQTWHDPRDVESALDVPLQDLQLDFSLSRLTSEVPHAYKAGENTTTIRHPSGNGKPVIEHDRSRRYPETWQAMEKLVDSGKARSIGIANLSVLKSKRILEVARIIRAVNQVEIYPYTLLDTFRQHERLEVSSKHGNLPMAHRPLGGRPIAAVRGHADKPFPTDDAVIVDIAAKYQVTPGQVCLTWAVQRGIPVIPKSTQEEHPKQNLQLRRLPDDLFKAVNTLATRLGPLRFLDPRRHIGFDIFDEEASAQIPLQNAY
ncbi:aldo-keto reductase [Chaetomium strumarium]|uniref:Aldo-keto reductase n=1 Tax=Chaetomium strumarium TaxID=1170767 RepID=A0AAJ0GN07_9PEZI|nr:aldo-keto reductase [Chaetomium strumarium]